MQVLNPNIIQKKFWGRKMISEQQIKIMCKLAVEYGNRPFSKSEKEALKEAIDQSNNWDELLAVAIASLPLGNGEKTDT